MRWAGSVAAVAIAMGIAGCRGHAVVGGAPAEAGAEGERAGTGTGTGTGTGGTRDDREGVAVGGAGEAGAGDAGEREAVGGEWIERLALPEGGVAYVTAPVGARERRPVVVAIHGAVDDPGLMCSAWRLVTDVYPFVVCPAGAPVGGKAGGTYVWSSSEHIEKRAREALEALEAKYPQHVNAGAPVVYAAFSQGANLAAPLLARNAKRFPRAVFTEGGHRSFEPAGLAQAYGKAGGERVLFTCSQTGCAAAFEASRAALERANVRARVVFSGAHGHSMPPPVRESVHEALPWVVEGVAGWEGYAAAEKLRAH